MGYVLGFGLAFMLVFGAVLPGVVNGAFNQFVRANYSTVESVKVTYLEAVPSSILTGQLSELNIKVNKITIGDLPVSAIDIVAKPVQFNAMDVVSKNTFTLTAPVKAHIKIMLTDEDFRDMFNKPNVLNKLATIETNLSIMPTSKPEKQTISILKPVITIEKNGLRADFILQKKDAPDTAVPITILANMEIHDEAKKVLDIHITSISVDGIELPVSLGDTIAGSLNPILNLSQYDTKDMKITFDKFTTYDGYLVLEGDTVISSIK